MSDAPRWLILHGGALGDLCLTLALALRLPGVDRDATVHVVSRADPGGLSDCRPALRQTSAHGLGLDWLYSRDDRPAPDHLRELLAGRSVLSALSRADEPIHARLTILAARVYSFDPRPAPQAAQHITQQWAGQLATQGLRLADLPDPPIEPSPRLRREGERLLSRFSLRPGVVLIHPGSGGRAKCWPLEAFEQVAQMLRDRGRPVAFLTGPVEDELWPQPLRTALAKRWPLLRCEATSDLAALLSVADVLLGNDAGPGHLAALLGTPRVTLFGPTRASVWQPVGRRAAAIQGDPAAGECWGIDPEDVALAVQSRLRPPDHLTR